MAEERAEVDHLVAVERRPVVRRGVGRPRVAGDRVRRRAEGEDVEDHPLVVALPVERVEPVLRRPAHRDERRARTRPAPLDASVERVGRGADRLLVGGVAVEVLLRRQRAGHQQRGVDRREFDVGGEARAVRELEEVVEEPLVAGDPRRLRPLRQVQQVLQRRAGPRGGRGARHVAALRADRVGGEAEADRGDAAEVARRPAVGHEPRGRVGRIPKPLEGPRLERLEQRVEPRGARQRRARRGGGIGAARRFRGRGGVARGTRRRQRKAAVAGRDERERGEDDGGDGETAGRPAARGVGDGRRGVRRGAPGRGVPCVHAGLLRTTMRRTGGGGPAGPAAARGVETTNGRSSDQKW